MRRIASIAFASATALGALVGVPQPAHAAAGAATVHTVTAAWGKVKYTIVRIGWTTRVTAVSTDLRADGDCVSGDVQLIVDGWNDPSEEDVAKNCLGSASGQTVTETLGLRPGGGFRYSEIQLKVCQEDAFADTCKTERVAVNPLTSDHPGLVDEANAIMNESMAAFKRDQAAKPGRFNWSNDGCSAPWYASVALGRDWNDEFKWACIRHDFGYRNYGRGLEIAPTDARREWVDNHLLGDMRDWCAAHEPTSDCANAANTYYAAVRLKGGSSFYAS